MRQDFFWTRISMNGPRIVRNYFFWTRITRARHLRRSDAYSSIASLKNHTNPMRHIRPVHIRAWRALLASKRRSVTGYTEGVLGFTSPEDSVPGRHYLAPIPRIFLNTNYHELSTNFHKLPPFLCASVCELSMNYPRITSFPLCLCVRIIHEFTRISSFPLWLCVRIIHEFSRISSFPLCLCVQIPRK